MLITQGVNLRELKPEIIRVIPVLKSLVETPYYHLHILKGFVETDKMTGHHAQGLAIDFKTYLKISEILLRRINSILGDEYEIKRMHNYIHLAFIGTVSFYKPDDYEDAFNHITKGVKLYGWC